MRDKLENVLCGPVTRKRGFAGHAYHPLNTCIPALIDRNYDVINDSSEKNYEQKLYRYREYFNVNDFIKTDYDFNSQEISSVTIFHFHPII